MYICMNKYTNESCVQTPPQVFVSRLNRFIRENQPPNFTVQLRWDSLGDPDEQEVETEGRALFTFCSVDTYNMHVI